MNNEINSGILTSNDIYKCRQELKDIIIAPFDRQKCKGIGYNLSPTEFCYSIRKKRLLQVHKSDKEVYVLIPPNDTVLTVSNEYLKVSNELAGCFLSRLRPVTCGMGNISTTLDPGWKGMLLLPISNPSSKKVKLVIKSLNEDKLEPIAIVTMLLWRTNSCVALKHKDETFTFKLDNPPMRTDIWDSLASGPPRFLNAKRKLFKKILEEMKGYERPVSAESYISQIETLLVSLEQLINHSQISVNEISDNLISLYHLLNEREMPTEIIEKIKSLLSDNDVTNLDSYNDFNRCLHEIVNRLAKESSYKNVFAGKIQTLRNECMYQELCEQVNGIHGIIEKRVKRRWTKGNIAQFWWHYIKPHIGGIISTIILMLILFSGIVSTSIDFIYKVMIGLVPSLTTLIFDRLDRGKADDIEQGSNNGAKNGQY